MLSLSFSVCLFWLFHINGIIQQVAFCVRLFSLNNLVKVHQCCIIYQNFIWPNNIELYGHTSFCLPIHQLIFFGVVNTFWLLWLILLWTFVYAFLYVRIFSSLWGTYLRVEVREYMVTLFNVLRNHYKVAALFYIPTSNVWGFWFLYTLATLIMSFLF